MNSKEFGKIRSFLGKTQKQLAQLLCVSNKAIQSYEQGWRKVPSAIERQMLLLLTLKKSPDTNAPLCWEIKNCPDEWRDNCIVWELKIRQYCWSMNGTSCQGRPQGSWDNKIQICRSCEVYKSTFPADLETTLNLSSWTTSGFL